MRVRGRDRTKPQAANDSTDTGFDLMQSTMRVSRDDRARNSRRSFSAATRLVAIQGPKWSANKPRRPKAKHSGIPLCQTAIANSGVSSHRERSNELRSAPNDSLSNLKICCIWNSVSRANVDRGVVETALGGLLRIHRSISYSLTNPSFV